MCEPHHVFFFFFIYGTPLFVSSLQKISTKSFGLIFSLNILSSCFSGENKCEWEEIIPLVSKNLPVNEEKYAETRQNKAEQPFSIRIMTLNTGKVWNFLGFISLL